MALRLIVTFKALPGKAQEFADAFKGLAEVTLKEQGCEQYELFRSQQDADTLVLLERWTSQEDLGAHMAAMQARGGPPTSVFNAETPSFERYEV
jgi:quinol monooxygenase YgiN